MYYSSILEKNDYEFKTKLNIVYHILPKNRNLVNGCFALVPYSLLPPRGIVIFVLRAYNYIIISNVCDIHWVVGWWLSVVVSTLALFNEVNRHWARLVLGWVTVYGQVNHLGIWPAT